MLVDRASFEVRGAKWQTDVVDLDLPLGKGKRKTMHTCMCAVLESCLREYLMYIVFCLIVG